MSSSSISQFNAKLKDDSRYIHHPFIWPNTVESRAYQKTIAEIASRKNTLVVLPTALGKTVIAALVTANILFNYSNLRVLVMAPTRPLTMQHKNSFLRLLKLGEEDVSLLTGKIPAEYRRMIWEGKTRALFATPQVVRNDLLKGRLALEDFGLLVFDECHRAVKKYAYTEIAQAYVSQSNYPLILGMTASPGSDLKRIEEVCQNLYIERVEYRSEADPDVKHYINYIDVEWKRVDLPRKYVEVGDQLRSMLNPRLEWLSRQGIVRRRAKYITRRNLVEAGEELRERLAESREEERGRIYLAITYQSLGLTLFHAIELLDTQGMQTLKTFLDKVERESGEKKSYAILTNDPQYRDLKATIDESSSLEHPKVELLKESVTQQLRNRDSARIIVFTQYRDTATHLVDQLSTIEGVRAKRFVGQASRISDKGLTQDQQAMVIKELEEGVINVVVATSIAEEGLDIPSVDQVIFYEPIPSEIRHIQRRGRTGRKKSGKVTILATNNTYDMIYLYASRRRIEKMKTIIGTLNKKLQTIIRRGVKPSWNPITQEELILIEAKASQKRTAEALVKDEAERARDFSRKTKRAVRSLYLKLLERHHLGENVESLISEMEIEGFSRANTKAAIERLIKGRQVFTVGLDQIALTRARDVHENTYKIHVERILPGEAVVLIDDRVRARLLTGDYNGPRALIKKNSSFIAVGELYRLEGSSYLRVNQVTQRLT